MLSKQTLQALGLKQNPFFSAREHVKIPPERMGTEWELSSIPEEGYDKDMGALKLDEKEISFMLHGKCVEYLATHTIDTQERRTIKRLFNELSKSTKQERNVRAGDDYEMGA